MPRLWYISSTISKKRRIRIQPNKLITNNNNLQSRVPVDSLAMILDYQHSRDRLLKTDHGIDSNRMHYFPRVNRSVKLVREAHDDDYQWTRQDWSIWKCSKAPFMPTFNCNGIERDKHHDHQSHLFDKWWLSEPLCPLYDTKSLLYTQLQLRPRNSK